MVAADPHRAGRRHAGAALLTLAAGLGLLGFAAGASAQTALEKLAQTGALACLPTLPVFCANTHVGCSGRTAIETFAFTLRTTPTSAWIESASDSSGIAQRYDNASVERASDGTYVILRPRGRDGYVKLDANGQYSFRHYANDLGTMSHGRCH